MQTQEQYISPTPGAIGAGDVLGLAAKYSAYDYFFLKARRFGNIATSGVPQGIFGLRAIGRRMQSAKSPFTSRWAEKGFGWARPGIAGAGGFFSGTGTPFGMFNTNPIISQNIAKGIGSYFQDLPLFKPGEVRGVRLDIARMGWREAVFSPQSSPAYRKLVRTAVARSANKEVARDVSRRVASNFVTSARLAGIGKIMGGVLPVVNTVLLAKLAIDLAGWTGRGVGGVLGSISRTASTGIAGIRGVEFGGSTQMFQTGMAMTERQRAMEAISRSSVNGRFMLGNEAAMYSEM